MARPISYDPELVLEKAMDLFWSRGYHAVSVAQLVAYTGLNRHSVYARFGSKYGLLQCALERYYTEIRTQLEAILHGPGTPMERLSSLFEMRLPEVEQPFWRRMLDRGCLAQRTLAELRDSRPDLVPLMGRFGEQLLETMTVVVREGQVCGEFRADRPADDLARVALSGFASLLEPVTPDEQRLRIRTFLSQLN